MKQKVYAKLKNKTEDFIVEEIRREEVCEISKEKMFGKDVDISNLSDDKRDFLICEMEKMDIDCFRAMRELASQLHKGIDAIGFAGTKDKKAWTCQKISIFEPDLKLIENFKHPNIYLKNFSWGKRKIKMGFLEGNRFKVVLRDVNKKDAIKVSSTISKLSFFPNSFGQQRFGSVRNNNVKIGKLILKRKFREAVWSILTDTNPKEREETTEARNRLLKEKDISKAAEYFPKFLGFERRMLYYLEKYPNNFTGALQKVERKNVLMFLHSVQSKLFNEILERALEAKVNFQTKGQQRIPLFGYKSKIDSGELGKIEKEVLKNHSIELDEFNIIEIPFLRLKGDYRMALIEVKNLKCEVSEDDMYKESKKICLNFDLPSGVYATTFIGCFFDFE